jgi:4-hydroxybenzoate polyprenyltransferase
MLKDYFQLFRAHTAPATVLALLTPYLIAGGSNLTIILILFILGHFVHYFSFGHNSLMDYWIDRNDPSKSHHPLPSGRIKFEEATKVILYGQSVTSILLSLVILLYSMNPALSLLFLLIYIVFGHAYNDGLDHRSVHSWFPISACYAGFVLVTYTFVRGLDFIGVLISLWAFLSEVYDIGLLGNVKDLWNPFEVYNPLRKYTTYALRVPICMRKGIVVFFWVLRGVITTIILYVALYLLNLPLSNLILLTILTVVELYAITKTCRILVEVMDRNELLPLFGLSEAFEFFRFTCLAPASWTLILMVYGLAYFTSFNKLLWGTRLGPRV